MKNTKIQVLRGIAIIAVVLIHTCNGGMWQVVCRPFINFAVALFLFLSGYLTSIENKDWKSFFKKRIVRVIIPYVIWTIINTFPNINLKNLAINLVTARSAATMYYIFVYIQFVLLTPLLGALAKSKYKWVGWTISPISVMIFKYPWILTHQSLNGYGALIWGLSCLGWFTFYYLGLLLGNKLIEKSFNLKTLFVLYGISILLQMSEGYGWLILGETNCGTPFKLSSYLTSSLFLLICYCFIIRDTIKFNSKILIFIGDYSFGIYLSHLFIMKLLCSFTNYSQLPFIVNSVVVLLTSLTLVWLGNRICGRKISKWIGFK